jgi:hypothetical protein
VRVRASSGNDASERTAHIVRASRAVPFAAAPQNGARH